MRRAAFSVRTIRRASISSILSVMSSTLQPVRPWHLAAYVSIRGSLVKWRPSPVRSGSPRFLGGYRLGWALTAGAGHAAGPGRQSRLGAGSGAAEQTRVSDRTRAQGAVAFDLDDSQRQSSPAEPGRAQGRRASGVERLGGD